MGLHDPEKRQFLGQLFVVLQKKMIVVFQSWAAGVDCHVLACMGGYNFVAELDGNYLMNHCARAFLLGIFFIEDFFH